MRFLFLLLLLGTLQAHAQNADDPARWESTIQQFEMADKKEAPVTDAILFVGSSSIVKWDTMAEDLAGHATINRGFGGSTFHDLIYYADRVIYPYQPKVVFVYEGDNDIFAGDTPEEVLKSAKKLRKMIAKNLGKDVPVVFISPKPSVARWELKAEYEVTNALLRSFTESKKSTYFVDVWTPALQQNGAVRDDIFVGDNLHLNAAGYDIWEAAIKPVVERLED
ncbi:GDSL-type esterase/lipase family protein [Neolewinella persica]|uniref:GDSL-type esterase/lipase family protein n=1 Tax=Neolewinella persica TaxID=70998 RepID=UPI00037EBF0B|nr:GDSL-type esterase/lipase family protein [Neolewinella persica]